MFSPINKCVLVKLEMDEYKHISTEQEEYSTRNKGKVVEWGDYPELENTTVIFQAYKEKDAFFTEDGVSFALVKYEDIYGVASE